MSAHTPGPWEFDPVANRVDAVALRKPTGYMVEREDGTKHEYIGGLIALVYGCPVGDDYSTGKHDANARLVAAAPRMYDALKKIAAEDHPEGFFARIANKALEGLE
jgi:hypothetical protein